VRNNWIVELLKEIENTHFHGKVILNCCGGDVPSIEKHERINKPITTGIGFTKKDFAEMKEFITDTTVL
jgi:hypothetical protein